MNCYLIEPSSINAYWALGLLYITAQGDSECTDYVNISQTPLTIFPPEYQIMTCACPNIGKSPYTAHAWFAFAKNPETVTVHTASGPQQVKVESFPALLMGDVQTPSILTAQPAKGEVIGVSPNSWDFNRAMGDAINQLNEFYPGSIEAVVTETGVVTLGPPVGMAFLYVRMKQIGASQPTEAKKPAKRVE
jgi:hypothetical protein